jgi:hypothetical protein
MALAYRVLTRSGINSALAAGPWRPQKPIEINYFEHFSTVNPIPLCRKLRKVLSRAP